MAASKTSARNTGARREAIIALLEEQGDVSVESLANAFDTSEVTIRKDLSQLEQEGILIRRYGGAALLPRGQMQDSTTCPLKRRLAEAAKGRIKDHARIVIDSGSTTSTLIPQLKNIMGLVVMTNSLEVANHLRELPNRPSLLMTGGTWDERSLSFQGVTAEQTLRAYDFDQLFIGADGIDLERGTTTFNELLSLSQVMAQVSREVVVMVESDKIGRRMPNLELDFDAIDVVITDDRLDAASRQAIIEHNVELVVVECPADSRS